MSYNMHGMEISFTKLYGMLKTVELNIKSSLEVLMVQKGKNPKKRGPTSRKRTEEEQGKCPIDFRTKNSRLTLAKDEVDL
ncbi:ATP-dependent DNA helicase Q5 [Cucumis melo var. makuwa]|uniref:ATP-dependent DNA helicase Q5 n=1 Tax=Cucumis melo var. makuwa TaxID=1194695 RepID=A0A5A7V1V2_CUCMM|nr:ATP-dependent DNA helicase Q5 [Cucumis melo var. makuwa]